MDDPKKEIGRRIKKYRKVRHMTQRKLAEKIGCAEITIRQYESGRCEPRLVMRRAIADALNVPYGNLFNIELIDEGKDRMKTISGIEFASEHNGTDVFRLIELAYEQGQKDVIEQLPSAQPEPLTDKEQRIFLAAMERERKICKEVDDQYVHEPYEVLLTKVCDEIERKVKRVLWT